MKFKIIIILSILTLIGIYGANYITPEEASLIKQEAVIFEKPQEVEETLPEKKDVLEEKVAPEEIIEEIIVAADQPEKKPEPVIVEEIPELDIIDKIVDWGHHIPANSRSIDTIIVHSCYDALGDDPYSVEGILEEFRIYSVAPHYLLGRDGAVYRFVVDQNIAWHAGVSKMPDGRTGVNSFSLGIELVNLKSNTPTEKQYIALAGLVNSLKEKYEIKYILGHNQIAPGRKTDPWNFDWQKFEGIMSSYE